MQLHPRQPPLTWQRQALLIAVSMPPSGLTQFQRLWKGSHRAAKHSLTLAVAATRQLRAGQPNRRGRSNQSALSQAATRVLARWQVTQRQLVRRLPQSLTPCGHMPSAYKPRNFLRRGLCRAESSGLWIAMKRVKAKKRWALRSGEGRQGGDRLMGLCARAAPLTAHRAGAVF